MGSDIDKHRLIGKRELLKLVPLSYSTIWLLMRRGKFPPSVRVGGRVFWRWAEVRRWLDDLPRSEYCGTNTSGKDEQGAGR